MGILSGLWLMSLTWSLTALLLSQTLLFRDITLPQKCMTVTRSCFFYQPWTYLLHTYSDSYYTTDFQYRLVTEWQAPVGNKHPLSCQCTSSNGLTVIACITMWGSWWLRRFTTDLKQSFAWTGELPILSQISIMRPHSSEVFFSSVAFSEIWQDVQQELLNGRTVDATNCQAQSLYGRFLRETWHATQPSQFVTSTLPSGTPNQLLE